MPNIKARNYDGEYITHENVNKVFYESADVSGTLIPFSYGETEKKTVDLDFSEGDMVLTPDTGKLWNQVDIPVPASLVPENIAKDVEIAGIVGTHETEGGGRGGLAPAIFTDSSAYAYSYYATGTNFNGGSPYVKVPLTANILGYVCGSDGAYKSSSGACAYIRQYGNTNIDHVPASNITVTEYETYKNITYTQSSVYTGGSSYKYKATCVMLIVYFTMPGIYMYTDENGEISIYADSTAAEYPAYNAGIPAVSCIDLSESVIQTLPPYMSYFQSCKTIKLPATLTSIGMYSLRSINLELLDFSLCESVPTLAGAYIYDSSNLVIRVPAALYDEWIAATNWSTYADCIVAV